MDEHEFQKALLNYTIHIADNQTRITEAMLALGRTHQETMATLGQQMATLSTQNQAIANILERVVQTTDRTEQIVARLLTRSEPDKTSH